MKMYYDQDRRKVAIATTYPVDAVVLFDVSSGYHAPVFKALDNKQNDTECPLEYLNLFLQSRSNETVSSLIYFYEQAATMFSSTLDADLDRKVSELTMYLATIPGVLPSDMIAWVTDHIPVPSNIMDEYRSDMEGIYTREKTYIKSEYLEYAALIMYSKLLLPIIGEYFRKLNMRYKSLASDFFTAYSSDMVEVKTHVEMLVVETLQPLLGQLPGVNKIIEFIQMSVSTCQINEAEIIIDRQLSMEDINQYIFAIMFTRKMVSAALYGLPHNNLASRLATSIRSVLGATGRTKIALNNDGVAKESTEDVKGVYDDTHAQYSLSVGNITILQYCVTDEYLLPVLGNKINPEYHYWLSTQLNRNPVYITQLHISIIASVLSNVISPIILSHCDSPTLVNLLSICHCLLKDKYTEIAELAISFPYVQANKEPAVEDVKLRLTAAHINLLERYFPLKTRKGVLTIAGYINEMIIPSLQYVLIHSTGGNTVLVNSDTLTKYVGFMCDAPTLVDPPAPPEY